MQYKNVKSAIIRHTTGPSNSVSTTSQWQEVDVKGHSIYMQGLSTLISPLPLFPYSIQRPVKP